MKGITPPVKKGGAVTKSKEAPTAAVGKKILAPKVDKFAPKTKSAVPAAPPVKTKPIAKPKEEKKAKVEKAKPVAKAKETKEKLEKPAPKKKPESKKESKVSAEPESEKVADKVD